jgi:prepilin-type N-terminal cleavage/methylation domain-containing protein
MGSTAGIQKSRARGCLSEKKRGFTLIEILVVIGIIAILAAIVIIAINPGRQFAQARDSQRTSNVNAILNAIGQNIADNKGIFTCSSYTLSATSTTISNAGANIRDCIVPTYMSEIPYDPSVTGAHVATAADYDTKYTVLQDTNGRITVCAPGAGGETAIAGAASICVTR